MKFFVKAVTMPEEQSSKIKAHLLSNYKLDLVLLKTCPYILRN